MHDGATGRRAALLLTLLLASPPTPAQTEEEQTRAQLEQLKVQIEQLNRELGSARNHREQLLGELRDAELALGNLQQQLRETRGAIAATEKELDRLQRRESALETQRRGQQERIASELETAWKMGRQEQVKILLNQENPQTVARAMAYYRYFFDAREELIGEFRATLGELGEVRAGIESRRAQLATHQEQLRSQSAALAASQREREQTAAALARNIVTKGDELEQLERNRKELEQLLETIQRTVIDLQLAGDYQPFAAARGQMPWPVDGKPGNRFGRVRNAANMRWQGVNIRAEAGSTVRAIHHGRVVYADWFRGSGLLLIIDHGDGYMSLYAHNESLLREVGEWVKPGTPIGTVGTAAGQNGTAIYFEVRHKGQPVDPATWCRG